MSVTDVASIEQLKYRYFRLLDLKRFHELGELLAEDATASYGDVAPDLRGRDAIVGFLEGALGTHGIISLHHGHHPEIEVTSPDAARGVWYLMDRVIIPEADLEISGAAFYDDRYRRAGETWFIEHTGYQRLFEEQRRHHSGELVSFNSRFRASD